MPFRKATILSAGSGFGVYIFIRDRGFLFISGVTGLTLKPKPWRRIGFMGVGVGLGLQLSMQQFHGSIARHVGVLQSIYKV